MASHRKPRGRVLQSSAIRRRAFGVTTAALASVTLLSQGAYATPADDGPGRGGGSGKGERPSVEEVRKQVDRLYQQAGASTQKYNAAKERTDAQRAKTDRLLGQAAASTGELNEARRTLGRYAAAQYRTGGLSDTAVLLLSEDPQGFFRQTHLMDRMTGRQKEAVEEYQKRQKAAGRKRAEASRELGSLASAQKDLKDSKQQVQSKLAEARELLSQLTEEEKARLAQIEREKQAEAHRKAAERAAAERREAAEEERQREQDQGGSGQENGSGTGSGSGSGSYAAKAAQALDYAKRQLGKPYVWGATGPDSFDCSGLTQAAWKAAGISLPRTTYDQVDAGRQIAKSALQPGDLVFFYDDVSHVGIYSGNGQMIHAPRPGDSVKYESIDYMPFHSAIRPA